MVKALQQGQNLPEDLTQVIDQLERHCLAPDGSLVSKPAYQDSNWREKKRAEKGCAMALYSEAIAMVEEYQQAASEFNFGRIQDMPGSYLQLGFKNSPQVYKTLEHHMVVAEAAQKLRLLLISKDGEIREEEIEKCSIVSQSSLDSTATNATVSSSSNYTYYATTSTTAGAATNNLTLSSKDTAPGVGGVPNRYLGITPAFLWQTQLQQTPSPWYNIPIAQAPIGGLL